MGVSASTEAIIELIHRVRVATAEQVCRRLYSRGSLTYVRERLARLAREGYLHRSHLGKASRAGSSPFVYTLDRLGRDYLIRLGREVERLRQKEVDGWSYRHLEHALAITELLIAAERLCEQRPDVRLRRVLTRELARDPARVRLGRGGTAPVIPDAWLDFRRRRDDGTVTQQCLAVEVDRGSEHQPVWREKVAKLVAWANGPYAQQFGTTVLTVAVTTTTAERRDALAAWTVSELKRLGAKELAVRFLLTAVSPAEADPTAFFLAPIWSAVADGGLSPAIRV